MKALLPSLLLLMALVPLGVQGQARTRDSITDTEPTVATKSLKRKQLPVSLAVAAACATTTTLNFATRPTNEDWKNHAPVNAGGGSTNTTISTAGSYVEPAGSTQTNLYVTPVNGVNALYWDADYTSTAEVTTQITYSFNRPVNNLSLRIQDIDLGAQAWVDKVTFTATQADGTVLNLSSTVDATVARDAAYISLSGNSLQGLQNVASNSTLGNATVTFNKPIVSFKITYQNVITGVADPLGQYIAIDYMTWCTQANVATTLAGPNHAKAGSTVTYTATTTASGDYAATGVQPKVQFTPGTVLATYPTGSTYVQATGVLTLPIIANLAIGASSTSTITYVMPATTVNGTASSTISTDDADPLDNNGSAATAKVTTVVNTPPVPTALSSTTPRAVYTQLSPLAATDANGDAISTYTITPASLTSLNTSGKLYVKSGSTYTEVTAGNYPGLVLSAAQAASLYFLPNSTASVGTVSFSYNATDSQGDISTTTAAYSLAITNSAPVAAATTYSGAAIYSTDGQKAITALQASDADGTIATYQIASLPTDGTLYYNTNADGTSGTYVAVASANLNTLNLSPAQAASLRFDPSGLASGNISFTFTAKDNNGQVSNTATYTIPVASSIAPVAANTTNSGTILSSAGQTTINSLKASDADGSIATYQIGSLPTDGTLFYNTNTDGVSGAYVAFTSTNIGTVTLTPAQAASLKFDPSGAFNGNVTFTFTAKDNVGNLSNVATYTVPVSNVAPVAADVTMTTAQAIPGANGPTAIPALTATDPDGTVASYQISALPGSGTLYYNTAADGSSGTYVAITSTMVNGGASQLNLTAQQAASLKYDPSGTTNSNVTFTYTATDNNGTVDATPATYTITLGNQAPRAISGTNSTLITSTKNDAYRLNWTAPNGTLSGSDADGTIASFTITGGLPNATTQGVLTYSTTNLGANVGRNNNGLVTITAGTVIPAGAYLYFNPVDNTTTTTLTLQFKATDNSGLASANTATYTVPVNQIIAEPVANNVTNSPAIVSSANATAITAFSGSLNGNVSLYSYIIRTIPDADTQGTLYVNGVAVTAPEFELPAADASKLTFDPIGTSNATVTFTYTVRANSATGPIDTTPATYTITLGNAAPVAATVSNSLSSPIASSAGQTAISSLIATDADGSISTYQIKSLPADGTLFYNTNTDGVSGAYVALTSANIGTVTLTPAQAAKLKYDPSGAFGGTVTFTYAATDNQSAVSNTATYSILVSDVDKEAVYTVATAKNVDSYTTGASLATVTDADGTLTSAVLANGSTLPAGVALNAATGQFTVSNAGSLVAGSYPLTINTVDATGGKSSSTITLTFTADKEAVYSAPNTYNQDALSNASSLATVTDADGTLTAAAIATGTLPAGMSFNSTTGQFAVSNTTQLVANAYTFTVNTTDATGGKSTVPVTITINADREAVYTVVGAKNVDSYTTGASLATVNDADGPLTSAVLVNGSTLPAGITLNATTGQFTVANAALLVAGSYPLTVTTTDVMGGTTTQTITLTFTADKEAVYSSSNNYNQDALSNGFSLATVTDADGALASAAIASGTLPSGMAFNTTTGQFTVSGNTAPAAGTYNFTVNTVDAAGGKSTVPVSIIISTDREAVYTVAPAKNVKSYSTNQSLATVTDADGAIVAAVPVGALPAGVALDAATGQLTVADAALLVAGTYTFQVSTTDALGGVTSHTVTLVFNGDADAVYTTTNTYNRDALSDGYSLASVTDTNGGVASASITTGTLPAGMAFNSTTGQFTVTGSTAPVAGTYTFRVNTVDAQGGKTTNTVTIIINEDTEAAYSVGNSYNKSSLKDNQELATVTDQDAALTSVALAAGSTLPTWLRLNTATGTITIPVAANAAAGVYNATMNTVDAQGGKSVTTVSITVTIPPLPVELTTFDVKAVRTNAQLTWHTAIEKNNDHYEVERSFDGLTFLQIGQVRGNGSSSTGHDYAFTDVNVGQRTGTVYYRLRQVDTDGKLHVTPVRTVTFAASAISISVYPNPAVTQATVDLGTLPGGTYQVQVLDMTGRVVRQLTLQGGMAQPLDIRSLAEGTYQVLIRNNEVNLTQKLVKRN